MNKKFHYYIFLMLGILSGSFCSCCKNDEDSNHVPKAEDETGSSVMYTITMSPDLLKFVTPQVNYVDENGNLVSISGVDDLDGKAIESNTEVQNGGSHATVWTSQVINETGYKCWTVQMKFNRLDFHTYLGVKYIRNDFTEDTTDKTYDFHHNVNTSISVIRISGYSTKIYTDSHVSITIGNYKKGDDIETYLRNLANNPDKVGYYINENGDVSRNDEFDL